MYRITPYIGVFTITAERGASDERCTSGAHLYRYTVSVSEYSNLTPPNFSIKVNYFIYNYDLSRFFKVMRRLGLYDFRKKYLNYLFMTLLPK